MLCVRQLAPPLLIRHTQIISTPVNSHACGCVSLQCQSQRFFLSKNNVQIKYSSFSTNNEGEPSRRTRSPLGVSTRSKRVKIGTIPHRSSGSYRCRRRSRHQYARFRLVSNHDERSTAPSYTAFGRRRRPGGIPRIGFGRQRIRTGRFQLVRRLLSR